MPCSGVARRQGCRLLCCIVFAAVQTVFVAGQTQLLNEQDGSEAGITFTPFPFTYNGGPRWKYDTREFGYSYVTSERPLANVPYSVLAGENFFGYGQKIFCNQTSSYNNLSCTNPPEQVTLTWRTQSVAEINTIDMSHSLNFYLKVQWRDWRLSYTEGGVTCFNAVTAPIPLYPPTWDFVANPGLNTDAYGNPVNSTADTNALSTQLLAVLYDAWGCQSKTFKNGAPNPSASCYPYLPRGAWPTVNVSYTDSTNSSLIITFFPAPNFLYAPGGPDGTTASNYGICQIDGSNTCLNTDLLYFPSDAMANPPTGLPTLLAAGWAAYNPRLLNSTNGVNLAQNPLYTISANYAIGGGTYRPGGYKCYRLPCTSQEQFMAFIYDLMASNTDPVMQAAGNMYPPARGPSFSTNFVKSLITCTGIRRTPGYLILSPSRQPDTAPPLGVSGYSDYRHPSTPSTINPDSFWTPFMIDSMNQLGDDDTVMDQWLLYPNGTVIHQYHFVIDYKALLQLDAFPFDSHYMLATRRTRSQFVDRVKINIGGASFSIPPKSTTWDIGSAKAIVCPRKEIGGDPVTDCRPLCTNVTCPGWQPGMPSMYVPPKGNCPPNPSCNATFPFPNCHLTCGETAALCQDVFIFYYPIIRKSAYYLQNMLAPIILVTTMAAASYWNELSDYPDRIGMMATALLSMMALQAYVSSMLPQTDTITFIHYALYTSYAQMGFGLAFIITVSFVLKHDIKAAGKGAETVQLWMMREFYTEALRVKRLIRALPQEKPAEPFKYFTRLTDLWDKQGLAPDAADDAAWGATHDRLVAGGKVNEVATEDSTIAATEVTSIDIKEAEWTIGPKPEAHKHGLSDKTRGIRRGMRVVRTLVKASLDAVNLDLDGDGRPEHVHPSQVLIVSAGTVTLPIFIPTMIYARRMLVEFDNFMRCGHLLSFALVIGARYFAIMQMVNPEPTCATVLNSFVPLSN